MNRGECTLSGFQQYNRFRWVNRLTTAGFLHPIHGDYSSVSSVADCTQEIPLPEEPILETSDLTRVVNDQRIVDRVTVGIADGVCTAITGPSGAGKSSFIRLLNRLDEPTDGTVYFRGTDYFSLDVLELRKQIGMVPQTPSLVEGTVYDNLVIGPRLREDTISEDTVEKLLQHLNLTSFRKRNIVNLSLGESQRVAIGRTLMNEPDVLLLDEPTSHLDQHTERRIERLLTHLMKEFQLTIVMITHSPEQAHRIADRILHMKNGSLQKTEPTGDMNPSS